MMRRLSAALKGTLLLAPGLAICLTGCGGTGNPLRGDFIDPRDYDRRGSVREEISALQDSLSISTGTRRVELHRKLAVAHRIVGTPASRLRSIEEIDAALRLAPDDPLLHVDKGLTRFAQRFIGDAVASMEKAIEIDPGCFYAWYHLGRIRRDDYLENMCFPETMREAAACFRRANAIDGTHKGALFNLGLLGLLDGLSAEASQCFTAGQRLYPDFPSFPLLAAVTFLQSDRFEDASERFEAALSLMDERERSEFDDIGPLLSDDEASYYRNLDKRNRNEYNRRFWMRHDPTPATPLNERLLEHYRRVFLARELLAVPRLELEGTRTARGRALIRYGIPKTIDYGIGRELDGPFVIWSYGAGDRVFRLYFQDEFLNGNYHIPIDPKFSLLADLTDGILRTVPQLYRYPLPFRELPVSVQWAQTRGPEGMTRVGFSLAVRSVAAMSADVFFLLDLAFFDADWNRFHSESLRFRTDTLAVIERSGAEWFVAVLERDLAPRALECTAALEIRGGTPPSRAVHAEPVLMHDFHGRSLAMSSVRITLADADGLCSDTLDPIPIFRRGSPVCIGYDVFNLRRDHDRRARYRVSYSIIETGPPSEPEGLRKTLSYMAASIGGGRRAREPFITNSFERGTYDGEVRDRLQIATATFGEGRYLLVLDVEDLVAKKVVSRQREFSIME